MAAKPKAFLGIKDFQPDLIPTMGWVGVVDRKHDGDTKLAFSSIGAGFYPPLWLRAFNVYAPELHEPLGPDALKAMNELVPDGTLIWVKTYYQTFERWAAVERFFDGPFGKRNIMEIALQRYPELFTQKGPLVPTSLQHVVAAKKRDEVELASRAAVR